ncbi:hypothetical protein LUZ60_003168 [Juncus effusus]|nr:hypothetical protein LUZ60_003168 [Juncus effusus]
MREKYTQQTMEREDEAVKLVKCECCSIWEECTTDYIKYIKDQFDGVWVCGLCSEAVKDEQTRLGVGLKTAVRIHTKFRQSVSIDPTAQIARSFLQMLKKMIAARKGVSVSDETL